MRWVVGFLAVVGAWVVLTLVFALLFSLVKRADHRRSETTKPRPEQFNDLLDNIDEIYFQDVLQREGRTPGPQEMPSYQFRYRSTTKD